MKRLLLLTLVLLGGLSLFAQQTIIVMEQYTGIGMQTYFNSGSGNSLQSAKIKEYWDKNYYITSAAHGSSGWFVSMSQGVKWISQSYSYKDSWPDSWIQEMKASGKYITTLAASDYQWFVVASSNTDYTAQEICGAPWSTLKDWISRWWSNSYYITSIACQNGMWTVVMSKTSLYKNQAYMFANSTSELKENIRTKWNAGYAITALEYGGGQYLCIMSQYSSSKTVQQHWNISTSFASDVKDYWDKSYRIIYIGG